MAKDTCRAVQSNLPGAKFKSVKGGDKPISPRFSTQYFSAARTTTARFIRQVTVSLAALVFCVGGGITQDAGEWENENQELPVVEARVQDLAGSDSLEHLNSWTGSWETTYGQLRLVQKGIRVYGDYHVRGVIEGRVSPDGSLLRGMFLYPDGRWGSFEFRKINHAFKGHWRWKGKSSVSDQPWEGNRVSRLTGGLILAVDSELQKLEAMMDKKKVRWGPATDNTALKKSTVVDRCSVPVGNQEENKRETQRVSQLRLSGLETRTVNGITPNEPKRNEPTRP